ncbi:MAG: orotidine-5'-phosphate decarboxylase [Endomicrobium sp.]|jgi:orotidine-5'-phosphate decarboxylase|nr:orotidine-5'-phosphate decarboxylase [Endomicrobium sp.]
MKIKKIILALDVYSLEKAKKLVEDTSPYIDIYKLGPILFLRFSKEVIKIIKDNGKKIFLDLKFHDIPNTVRHSVESAKELGIFSLTVHAVGGEEMLRAATQVKNKPKIWAVTTLTSQTATPKEVIKRAKFAKFCGVDGVISSPLEVALIKKECGEKFDVAVPGIRLSKNHDDQKRIASPETAINAGADFIIIGRPILEAINPADVTKNIYENINMIK